MTAAEWEQEEWRLSAETKGTPPSPESFQRLVPLDLVTLYGEALGKGREMPEGPQVPLRIGYMGRWAMRSALTGSPPN